MVRESARIKPIILAGGFGTRAPTGQFAPKQFIKRGDTSLYQDTLSRLSFMEPPLVMANEAHRPLITQQSPSDALIIHEPIARNTAAATVIALLTLQHTGYQYAAIFPSDHIIHDTDAFERDIRRAVTHIQNHPHSALFTVPATAPSPAFGYIQTDHFGNVTCFHEKPSIEQASGLLQSSYRTYWNAGIFLCTIDHVLDDLQRHNALFFNLCLAAFENPSVATYQAIPSLSFDALYLEQANNLFAMESSFDWADAGTAPINKEQVA